jgi:AcrR family transcriptional regulator
MDEKLKLILDGSGRLLLKYGLRNLSMDDISRDLSISKKTLYQYVENKADLIDKVMMNHLDEDWKRVIESVIPGRNAIDVLLSVSKQVCEHTKEINPNISFELQKFYPDVYKKFIDKQRSQIMTGMRLNIEQGMQEGLFRSDVDIDVVLHLYTQAVEDIHQIDIKNGANVSYDKLLSVMFENHIRGIASQEGLEYLEKVKNESKNV